MPETRRGLLFGVAAYAMWGFFPLYWRLLEETGALELLAARVTFSLLVMVVLVLGLRKLERFRALVRDRRLRRLLTLAAVLISVNWFVFIWGVNNGRVLEISLGYFITPLVSVLLGVVVLRERLRRTQWAATGLAVLAVVVLAIDYGRLPWVGVALALSFGFYGLLKKQANVGAVESLAYETLVILPVAVTYLIWLGAIGEASYLDMGPGTMLLLVGSGLLTALPLLCFGGAATRVTLTTMGLLQYIAPTLQFLIGVLVFSEALPLSRLAGFVLVWTALVVFTVDAWRNHRRQLRLGALASSAA
ncbi:EamA family transporter RarD [Nocardioides massiliensis]|uniref:Chloramphenicol-sensitive protein RarD n=1 Tax=Nocardioides massiliensis TaxID=1325935 RepID=A0ABT9NJW0_9ACTN|nr:EamA family transporter RarD [Nocardioides massiliensis]MDP9820702.1 chloramphenicol-sensitive protein RarD [Nocardioides massiliensis]